MWVCFFFSIQINRQHDRIRTSYDFHQLIETCYRPVAENIRQRVVDSVRHYDYCAAAVLDARLPQHMVQNEPQSVPKVCATNRFFYMVDTLLQRIVIGG